MNLLSAVSAEDMHRARIITALTFVGFLAVGFAPGLRPYAYKLRIALVALYLSACILYVGWVLLR